MPEVFDFATSLAKQAGAIPLKYFKAEYEVIIKEDASPVTIADSKTEEFLRKEIENRFPDDGILGEEFGEKKGTSGRRWILDPIDGTQSFVRGLPLFGCMIAVEEDGNSRIGVIHYPATNETLSAMRGAGCFYNNRRCGVSGTMDFGKAVISTSYPHKVREYWGDQLLSKLVRDTAMIGTYDCYGYLLVATGQIDGLIEPTLKLWDVAPLFPIIEEAGGIITDIHGNRGLDIENVVMGNNCIWNDLKTRMQP